MKPDLPYLLPGWDRPTRGSGIASERMMPGQMTYTAKEKRMLRDLMSASCEAEDALGLDELDH